MKINDKIAITGVNGFIGANLAKNLLNNGYKLIGITNKQINNHSFPIVTGDLNNEKFLKKELKNISILIHLAQTTKHKDLTYNAAETFLNTVTTTYHLLNVFCNCPRARLFFYPSSSKVYGRIISLPIRENHPTQPTIPLGQIKLANEQIIKMFANKYNNLKFIITRIFNVYGLTQKDTYLIPTILQQLQKSPNHNTLILGNLNDGRDYIYIDDLCTAIETLLRKFRGEDINNLGIYNIGSGKSYTVSDITKVLENITLKNISITQNKSKMRFSEAPNEIASVQKIKKLGWRTKYTIEEGLKELISQKKLKF